MFDEDNDEEISGPEWLDSSFGTIRIIAATVVEYGPMVKDIETPAGWAIQDLRSMNHDILQAVMDDKRESAEDAESTALTLMAQLLRLID
jgi:hypothetical protein